MNSKQSYSLPENWDNEVDVIVVGSGFSGLAAAIEARDLGASVLILEKRSQIGGNSIFAVGYTNAVYPERQSAQGIDDSLEKHFEQTWRGGGQRCNPDRIRAVVAEGKNTIDWLEKIGVEMKKEIRQGFGALWPRSHLSIGRGKKMILAMKKEVENRDIPILLEHKVTGILREKLNEGRILGVRIQHDDNDLYFKARKGVIIASGGFSADDTLIEKHSYRLRNLDTTNHKDATGEIIVFSQDVGADVVGMDYIQSVPKTYDVRTGKRYSYRVLNHLDTPYILYINYEGKRIINSDAPRDNITDAILSQPEQCCLLLCDDKLRKDGQVSLEDAWRRVERGTMFGGNTLKELAENIGVPIETLQETIDTYNSFVDQKNDPEFRQAPHVLIHKCDTPPYWATVLSMARHYTCGGLQVGGRKWTQVLDRWGKIIPGLFAAGEVTGGFHGTNRLGANAILECIVAGRWAGIAVTQD
jgi:urocanate reductase